MSPRTLFQCELDRVPELDEGSMLGFVLRLVASSDDAAEMEAALMALGAAPTRTEAEAALPSLFPWTWTDVKVWVCSNVTYQAEPATLVLPNTPALSVASGTALRDALFAFLLQAPSAFRAQDVEKVWRVGNPSEVHPGEVDATNELEWKHWPTIQAQLYNHPGALPRDAWSNVWHVRLTEAQVVTLGGDSLFATVSFRSPDGVDYQPGALVPDAGLVKWSYASGPARAMCAGCSPNASPNPFLASSPATVGFTTGDWVRAFRRAFADEFEFAEVLVNAARTITGTDAAICADRYAIMQAVGRAQLPYLAFGRTTAQPPSESVDGRDLHDDVVSRVVVAIEATSAEEESIRDSCSLVAAAWLAEPEATRINRWMAQLSELSGYQFTDTALSEFADYDRVMRALVALRSAGVDEARHRERLGSFVVAALQDKPDLSVRAERSMLQGVLAELPTLSRARADQASPSYFTLVRNRGLQSAGELKTELGVAFDARLDALFGGVAPRVPLDVTARIDRLVAQFPDSKTPPPPQFCSTPLPLRVAVGTPAAAGRDESVDDGGDAAELIGHAVLMRTEGRPWRALHFGEFKVGNTLLETEANATYVALQPSPIAAMAGLVDGGLAYDNVPALGIPDSTGKISSMTPTGPDRLVVVQPCARTPVGPDDMAALPSLGFGRNYHSYVLPVRIGGVLPHALRSLYDVTVLKSPIDDADIPKDRVQSLSYWRTVGVQALTVTPDVAACGARVLREDRLLARVGYAPDPPIEVGDVTRRDPPPTLVLLPESNEPQHHEAAFDFRPPVTDAETYLRWVAGADAVSKPWLDRRRCIRAAQRLLELDNIRTPVVERKAEYRRIEDPGVTSLVVEIVRWGQGQWIADVVAIKLERGDPVDTSAEKEPLVRIRTHVVGTQAKPVGFRVRTDPNLKASSFDKATRVLSVAPLDVAQVRVYAAIARAEFDNPGGRFWKGMALRARAFLQEQLVGFNPLVFNVEAASGQTLPAPASLYESFALERADGGDALVHFRPADEYRHVGRVEIGWQYYRWLGRPVPRFPRDKRDLDEVPQVPNASPLEFPTVWDAVSFADRSDGFADSANVDLGAHDARKVVHVVELHEDRRERYLRFGFRAHHRYQTLYARNSVPAQTSPVNAARDGGPWTETWRRFRKPATRTSAVEPPLLKVVLPLTRGAQASAGVLVVLNEPYGEAGGLCEEIDVAAETASITRNTTPQTRVEIGRDVLSPFNAKDDPSLHLPALRVRGPYGHTFDTDTAAPYFAAASFVVSRDDARPFDLAKLKFRRRLEPSAFTDFETSDVAVHIAPEQTLRFGQATIATVVGAEGVELELALDSELVTVSAQAGGISATAKDPSRWRQCLTGRATWSAESVVEIDLYRLGPETARDEEGIERVIGSRWELAIARRSIAGDRHRFLQAVYALHAKPGQPLHGIDLRVVATSKTTTLRATWGPRLSGYASGRWAATWLSGESPYPVGQGPSLSDARLVVDPNGRFVVQVGATQAPLLPWTANGSRFFHAALVTEAINDAAGRPTEAYAGIADLEGQTGDVAFRLRGSKPIEHPILRVMTLETDPRFKPGKTVMWDWDDLFSPEPTSLSQPPRADVGDALMRIVSMSDPIGPPEE